jgi:branched-chain amino acid aminotransferase
MHTIFNGQLIEDFDATIPATDKGYFFDFAVYDSTKVIQGKSFFPEFHIERLLNFAAQLEIIHPFSQKEVENWLDALIEKNELTDAYVRFLLVGDPAGKPEKAKLFISSVTGITYYPNKFYSEGIKTITYQGERCFPTAKTTDLLLGFLAKREATRSGAEEALLVDNNGFIREGSSSNFFAIRGKELIVPPDKKNLLGITKKILLEIAEEKFDIVKADIPRTKIASYDEVFITSTLRNVMPIRQINDVAFENGFEKTKMLAAMFKKYYTKHTLKN